MRVQIRASSTLSDAADRWIAVAERIRASGGVLAGGPLPVDLTTAPLRNCLSYYNGHGEAAPGSLAYYGGPRWHDWRTKAQATLEPYIFRSRPEPSATHAVMLGGLTVAADDSRSLRRSGPSRISPCAM